MLRELERWLKGFEHTTFHKGKAYADHGLAKVYFEGQDWVKAKVYGSRKTPYDVNLRRMKSGEIFADCTCPVAFRCKHMAAVGLNTLELLREQSKMVIESEPALSIEENRWLDSLSSDAATKPLRSISSAFIYTLTKVAYDPLSIHVGLYTVRLKKGGEPSSSSPTCHHLDDLLRRFPERLRDILTEDDWEILGLLWQRKSRASMYVLSVLKKIVETKRCYWGMSFLQPLVWEEEKEGNFEWEYNSNGTQTIRLKGFEPGTEPFLMEVGGFYVHPGKGICGPLKLPCESATARKLLKGPVVHEGNLPVIQKKLAALEQKIPILEKTFIAIPKSAPKPLFWVGVERDWNHDEHMIGRLSFQYGDHLVPFDQNITKKIDISKSGVIYRIERDLAAEVNAIKSLLSFGWRVLDNRLHYSRADDLASDALDFWTLFVPVMKSEGWTFEFDPKFPIQGISESEDWYAEVSEHQENWFDLELGSVIDGKRVNLVPVLHKFLLGLEDQGFSFDKLTPEQLKEKVPLSIGNGELLMMPISRLRIMFDTFLGLLNRDEDSEKIRLSKWEVSGLDHLEGLGKLEWQTPASYQKLQERLKAFGKIELIEAPKALKCDLRPYQLEGVSWLQFLRTCDLGGVLADDMGLGKTVQTLAHILIEKASGRMESPVLVVAPTTLMGNWFMETERFAPQLKVLILQGNERKKGFDRIGEYDLILTTYPLLARDREIFLKHKFHLLILDEAQNVKNAKTQAHKVIREIRANHRLCLTGTPMENHLGELWSLFHVLLPGFLGDEKQFQKLFRKPIEKEGSLERKKVLQKRISPFMLRRTKQQVILELPPKTEILTPIELTQKQRDLYEAVRLTMMQKVLLQVEEKGLARSRIVLLDALLKLRQICCDPRLLKAAKDVTIEDSAKLVYLRTIIPQMISEKRQILLFSQFTSMLALIEKELYLLNIPYTMITGDTQNRIEPVQKFQAGIVPLMLISLKAGGTGLNLTAADTVIHYDPWWNPATENQATDRAHRMGQTKPVFVYKLITSGSVEEKILSLQRKKKELAAGLFDESNTAPLEMNLEDLQSLFEPLGTGNQ